MIKIDSVKTNTDNVYNSTMESQFLRRLELLEQVRNRTNRVEENQRSDTNILVNEDQNKRELNSSGKNNNNNNNNNEPVKVENNIRNVKDNKIKFHVDDTSGKIIMRLVDPDTGKVLKEIPEELMKKELSQIENLTPFIDTKI